MSEIKKWLVTLRDGSGVCVEGQIVDDGSEMLSFEDATGVVVAKFSPTWVSAIAQPIPVDRSTQFP